MIPIIRKYTYSADQAYKTLLGKILTMMYSYIRYINIVNVSINSAIFVFPAPLIVLKIIIVIEKISSTPKIR